MWLGESSSCSKHRVFYTRYLTTQRALSDKNTLTHKSSFQFWTAPFQGWTRPRCRGSRRGRGRTAAAPAPLTHTLPLRFQQQGPRPWKWEYVMGTALLFTWSVRESTRRGSLLSIFTHCLFPTTFQCPVFPCHRQPSSSSCCSEDEQTAEDEHHCLQDVSAIS